MPSRVPFSKLYVNRLKAESAIVQWIGDPLSKRVGVIEAPPGSGKSWLIKYLTKKSDRNRAYRPFLLISSEEWVSANPDNLRAKITDLQTKWAEQVLVQLKNANWPNPNSSYLNFLNTEDPTRRTQYLAEMLGLCPKLPLPVFFWDGYDEINESTLVKAREYLIDPLIRHGNCIKIILSIRPGVLINGLTLRDQLHYFDFEMTWIPNTPESATLQIGKITKLLSKQKKYPDNLLKKIHVAMLELEEKGILQLPFVVNFLHHKQLVKATNEGSPENLDVLLTIEDCRSCLLSLMQGTRITNISENDLSAIRLIAARLGPTWSQTDFKNSGVAPIHSYLGHLNELKERGLVIYIEQSDNHKLVDGTRELLRAWHTLLETSHD